MIEAIPSTRLYRLSEDAGETTDVSKDHPEVVERLMKRIEWARGERGDVDQTGKGARLFDKGPRRFEAQ